eukprot:6433771-Ditylum_brightwellii.AAC.1
MDPEEVLLLSDMRKLNYCDEGGLRCPLIEAFMGGARAVIEMSGSGTHPRRHAEGTDLEQTTNIVYTSSINSIEMLVRKTKSYMLDKKKLEEGKDFRVPCNEILRR